MCFTVLNKILVSSIPPREALSNFYLFVMVYLSLELKSICIRKPTRMSNFLHMFKIVDIPITLKTNKLIFIL
jgi:hypothetical protein